MVFFQSWYETLKTSILAVFNKVFVVAQKLEAAEKTLKTYLELSFSACGEGVQSCQFFLI